MKYVILGCKALSPRLKARSYFYEEPSALSLMNNEFIIYDVNIHFTSYTLHLKLREPRAMHLAMHFTFMIQPALKP